MRPHTIPSSLLIMLSMACAVEDTKPIATGDTGIIVNDYDDADGDGIIDGHDGLTEDFDGDGDPNYQDTDSDGDGILDEIEAGDDDIMTLPVDSDQDGYSDFLDLDSDNNCIDDSDEKNEIDGAVGDTDNDGIYDFADTDNDGDGISDVHEIGLDCGAPDTDGDGIPNFMDIDSDGDGIGDVFEGGTSEWEDDPRDTDEDGIPDYLDADSDADGVSDSIEGGVESATDEPKDTDGDGDYDFADTDADGDSLPDWDEINIWGTDPYDADTDGDGFSDGGEIAAGTDPRDDGSTIDGIYVEVSERTGVEENFEFELRIQMGDVGFLLDTTGSMSGTANAMASEFSSIVTTLNTLIPDAEYGFATYDDYAFAGYGYSASGDKPFILRHQVTDNTAAVQAQLTGVPIHFGGDWPESTMEALYQGAYGKGYDQNCNGVYEAATDIQPYIASEDDPFGGTGGQGYSATSSGGGELGGFGFRDYALPVMVYATDAPLRDSDDSSYGTPGGCPLDAGLSDVVDSITALGGYTIGIMTSGTSVAQMEEIASATGSVADTDGDGMADDLLVFRWTGSSSDFRETVTNAIEDLINSIRFSKVELEVVGDEWGFVTSIEPPYYDDIEPAAGIDVLDFTLNFRGVVAATTEDQLYALTLNVIGDDTILLDTLDIIVVVPGTAY
jgi:hypothetical protein